MARLILHSDDFGLHPEINRAILEAAGAGVLSSASLLVNAPAAAEAIAEAAKLPALGVGLHLNILRGRPISPAHEIPSLVDGRGFFCNSIGRLLRRAYLGLIKDDEVLLEYRRQAARAAELGLKPTHFDSEKHTHLLIPACRRALPRIMQEYSLFKVRTISEKESWRRLAARKIAPKSSLAQRLKLKMIERGSHRAKALWGEIATPELFFGVVCSGSRPSPLWADILRAFFSLEGVQTIEWMLHLGYSAEPEEGFGAYFLGDTRVFETRFLLSPEVRDQIAGSRTQLISYRDL